MGSSNKAYVAPRLERYGPLSELTAGGSGSMTEGSGFAGGIGQGMTMIGPGIGNRDSRP